MSKNKAYEWKEVLDIEILDFDELDIIRIEDMKNFAIKSDGVTSELIMETALIRPISNLYEPTHFRSVTYFRCTDGYDYRTHIEVDNIISINSYIIKNFSEPATQIIKIKFKNENMNIKIGFI